MNTIVRRRVVLVVVLVAGVAGVALGLTATNGRSARDTLPPFTKKIAACERNGKVICDPAAYRRNRKERLFPLSKPDPKGARLLTLAQVWPRAETERHFGAELMTYGQAARIAPGLAAASSAAVNPSRKVWVITRYHPPPISLSDTSWDLPPGVAPRMVRVRSESQVDDALTGRGIDSCINCAAVPEQLRYWSAQVTLSRSPAGYHPDVSRSQVLVLLQQSGFAAFGSGQKPIVQVLWARGGTHPGRRSYPAWVITYPHRAPTSYGPGPVSQNPVCAFVSIYDLRDHLWTTHFQDCPDNAVRLSRIIRTGGGSSSCHYACTPPNQDALDADANDARRIAGRSYYTGAIVHADTNTVDLYLATAPQSVIDQLNAAHSGIYVIHNDAPHTSATLLKLEAGLDEAALRAQGIDVNEWGPTVDGYLQVGVTNDVAAAQAKLDQIYGPNFVHVYKSEPIIFGSLTSHKPMGFLVGAIRVVGGPVLEGRRKGGGLATVFNSRGHAVAVERVRAGHDFRFRLSPGRYRLGFGRKGRQGMAGCDRGLVTVRVGKTTHADLSIGCDLP